MTSEELRNVHCPILQRMLDRLDSEYDTAIESFSEDYFQVWEEWCAIKSALESASTIERLQRENAEAERLLEEAKAAIEMSEKKRLDDSYVVGGGTISVVTTAVVDRIDSHLSRTARHEGT